MKPLLALLLLAGCVVRPHPQTAPPMYKGRGWVAVEQHLTPGEILVIAVDAAAEQDAIDSLCPKDKYLCLVDPYGGAFFIERKRKR